MVQATEKTPQGSSDEVASDVDTERFLSLSAIGWIIASAISSSLIDKSSPDAISVALGQMFSSEHWLTGIASLAGSITAGGIPGVLFCGIFAIFIKKLRSLRNFILASAVFNLVFGIWLM
jgi:hypothetical protein